MSGAYAARMTFTNSGARMRFSFSTGTFYPFSLATSLRLARDLGYDGVEMAMGPEALYLGAARLRRTVERIGVPILSVHPPFASLPGWPRSSSERLPRIAALARDLGAEVAITHTVNFFTPASHRNAIFTRGLARACDIGGDAVSITIENNHSGYARLRGRVAYLDHTDNLVAYARARGCGLTYDTCHAAGSGDDTLAELAAMRPLLRNVHLNDLRWNAPRHSLSGRRWIGPLGHLVPGDGQLPMRDLLQSLARDGYDGLVTIELHPREIGWWGPGCLRRAERALARGLTFMRDATRVDAPVVAAAPGADRS